MILTLTIFFQKTFSKMKIVFFIFVPKFAFRFYFIRGSLIFSRRMNTIIYSSKQFKKYHELSSNRVELYECFMKRYNELMDRISFSFSFVNCLFFRYWLEFLNMSFALQMSCVIYFSVADLPVLLVNLSSVGQGSVHDCLLRMTLFCHLNIIFLIFFQIDSVIRKLNH